MKILWMSNHPVSPEQRFDCERKFGKNVELVELGPEGKKLWADVNPEFALEEVSMANFWPAVDELLSEDAFFGEYFGAVVVMGELSLCLSAISACALLGVAVFTPTTKRVSVEIIKDGVTVKTNKFRHVQLRCLHKPERV